MAKFTTYYNLFPIHTKEFLDLSRDKDEGNIILTHGRNMIIVIKITTQKQIRSWTVVDKLSSKVVFDKRSDQYVAVFQNKFLRCWSKDTNDVNSVKKLKFQKNIAGVVESDLNEVIIIYSDYSCESLSHALECRKTKIENSENDENLENPIISDANIFRQPDRQIMLTYFVKSNKDDTLEIVISNLDEDTLTPITNLKKYPINRRDQNVKLAGYVIVEGEHSPTLVTIWLDKRMFLLPLSERFSEQDIPGNFASIIDFVKVDSALSMTAVSKHCIAIYGANTFQEGASIMLYNTQFKVVKTKQFFKIYFNFSHLWTLDNNILLAMGQNLSVVSFRVSKELLSDVIGTQISNNFYSSIEDSFINEEDYLEESLSFVDKRSSIDHESISPFPEAMNLSCSIADGMKIPYQPYEQFEETFRDTCNKTVDIKFNLNKNVKNLEVNLLANCYDRNFARDEFQIISQELEKCGCSEHEITEKLLTVLIKADLPEEIASCLRKYTSIPTKMIAKLLSYALTDMLKNENTKETLEKMEIDNVTAEETINGDDEQKKKPKINMENAQNIDRYFPNVDIFLEKGTPKYNIEKKSDLLPIILSCSLDVEGIEKNLRKELDFEQVVLLIKYLYDLINSDKIHLEDRPDTGTNFNEDLKILEWFGILLNTHYGKLALSRDKELINILEKWSETIAAYIKDLKELEELYPILNSLIKKKLSNKRDTKYSKWYSIEEVKLF